MFINKDSIKMRTPSMQNEISMGNYIVEAKFAYNKLWGEDTTRNLNGTMTGTLIGIFPKIILQFRKLTKEEFETIAPILDSPTQIVTYYDPVKKYNTTIYTYTGDYEVSNKKIISENGKCESFSCSFIAQSKRS